MVSLNTDSVIGQCYVLVLRTALVLKLLPRLPQAAQGQMSLTLSFDFCLLLKQKQVCTALSLGRAPFVPLHPHRFV
jgi:hypothetical protein